MKRGKIRIITGCILIVLQILGIIGNSKTGLSFNLSFDNFSIFLYDLMYLIGYFIVGIIGVISLILGFLPTRTSTSIRKRCSTSTLFTILFSIINIIIAIISMNIQDIKRNTFESINPTILYFVLISINAIIIITFLMKEKMAKLRSFSIGLLSLFLVFALLEGSIFSAQYWSQYGYYRFYNNNEVLYVLNVFWVVISILIIVMSLPPYFKNIKTQYYKSIRYREQCYKRVEKMKTYLDKKIITEEEFEKNKQEILKNIKM